MRSHFQINGLVGSMRRMRFCGPMGLLCLLGLVALLPTPAAAQIVNYAQQGPPPQAGLELLQETPHDLLFFKPEAGGGWAKVELLDLPGRQMPTTSQGKLKIRVNGIAGTDLSVKWEDIERIDFWEQRLEREAVERIKAKDFTGAYPFVSILIRDYPERPNLRLLRSEFLLQDAAKRFRGGELEGTLAMLEELRRYDRQFKPQVVLGVIGQVTDKLMQRMLDNDELAAAQQLHARLEKDYRGTGLASIDTWDKKFTELATAERQKALAALEKKDYRSARQFSRRSLNIKPDLDGAADLVRRVDLEYPLVNVGVLQTATVTDPTRLENWASRRAGRLLYRIMFETQGVGPEGGEYEFIFGETEQSADRMRFSLFINPDRLAPPLDTVEGFRLADRLAARTDPEDPTYYSAWAAALQSIELVGPQQVNCQLRRPSVLPAAMLQLTVDGQWFGGQPGEPTGDYRRDVVEGDVVRYTLRGEPRNETQIREIVEQRTESAADGVEMLLRGEVDVLDQLFPADAARLRGRQGIKVATYPLPSVHMLVPCSEHRFLADKTFRRGLLYSINRQDILAGELLEGLEVAGCQVLSGPFPAGLDQQDPLGYAYDREILARGYEPRLGKLLMTLTQNQFNEEAKKAKLEPPVLQPIRLAFPADNLSRLACEAIKSQWELLDVPVQLVELPIGVSFPEPGAADIAYVSAAVWEPILDARRVLGPRGLAGSTDQLVGLGLRLLENSKNWREARDGLLQLHAITNSELPILPLWQIVDSYAYSSSLGGVGSDIVSLYQNAAKWRLSQ